MAARLKLMTMFRMDPPCYNGDGKSDILWRDNSGNVAIWFMNGAQVTQFAGVATVPTIWSIQGVNAD